MVFLKAVIEDMRLVISSFMVFILCSSKRLQFQEHNSFHILVKDSSHDIPSSTAVQNLFCL